MEGISTKYTAFVLVMLATFADCKFTTLNVVERDVVFLNFSYSCNSTKVTLQRGNGAHIYNSKIPIPLSSSNLRLINETDGETCFLYLTINPVTKEDEGGYVLFAYKNDPTLYEDDRIQLWVKSYLPSKASCSSSGEHIDPDWVRLQCTAPIGSIGGYIMCYQDGIKIPPFDSLQEYDGILHQTLLAKEGDLVYCCSGTLDQTKDRCECKDTVWDPIQKKQVTNVTGPCSPTVPIQYSTFSRQPTDEEFELTSPSTALKSTPPQINSGKVVVGLIVVICLLIIVIGILIAVLLYCKKHHRETANRTEENGVQEAVISEPVSRV